MHVINHAHNLYDAQQVKHALEAARIPALVFGESLLGGMGELPLFGVLRVCVPDLARPEAEQIVAGLDLGGPQDDPIWDGDESAGPLPA
jgi:hypothetical protein